MKDLTDAEFAQISGFIRTNYGIDLGLEKKALIYSRLRATLVEKGFGSFSEYFGYLINNRTGEAVAEFIDKVTTNHTYFMREADHFDFLRDTVLPELEASNKAQGDVRLWCAGCSSGEEPYTLQMVMADYFAGKPGKWDTTILATDISTQMLEKAAAGVYPNDALRALPENWEKEYFEPFDAGRSIINPSIRNAILFRKLNLMDRVFPFRSRLHVIFCRNVMIYFDMATKNELVKKFRDWLLPGGYLFVGHSEPLSRAETGLKYVAPAVYQKIEN
ncbi:MAG: protein-glutamate O-methyltransferase CheR [Defluviitaleaceae bacterium]|nr:protein-glutamate O-methyltransferase CheR [Defluviitaleaceae bacterium]